MRGFLIVLAACGSTKSTPRATRESPGTLGRAKQSMDANAPRGEPVDPITGLTRSRVEVAWIDPGPAQLVLGGTSIQASDDKPLAVDLLEERGSEVRVGVRLDHVRFALWTSRTNMLGVLARHVPVSASASAESPAQFAPSVILQSGTHVYRLAHKDTFTQIRYSGSLEVEGWVPDAALVDVGPADHKVGHRIPNLKPLMVSPGATIRTEKRWAARALAVARYSMFVDNEEVLADGWHRVAYRDGDVWVNGFLSKRDPPSRTHGRRDPEPAVAIAPNATVPADTCLYAGDEPIGFVVGDRPAYIEPSPRVGWLTLTLDTPWGPLAFDASGPTESALAKCGSPAP